MPLGEGPLDGDEIAEAVTAFLPPHAQRQYRDTGIADGSYRSLELGRFRINLHRERGRAAAAIRRLPAAVPRLATLGLPPSVESLSRLARGLVLIGGPTGSGKTTTVAALVNEINHRDARHIITIEDPIEYEHPHRGCLIEQVEIGIDAPGFPHGAARGSSTGARHHRRRRDARSGDDADCADGGRNGTPGVFEPAHDRRRVDGGAHRGLVSRPSARTRSGRNWRWRWLRS